MKKYIYLLTIILFGLITAPAYATTNTTPAPTKADGVAGKLDDQINQLKEKIASRVSELNLVEKRGMIGTVTEVKGNQITLTDVAGNTRFIDVDEITKFASAGTTGTFGLSDITSGAKISVLGIYNKQSKRMLARFIKTYAPPTIYSGAITAIDAKAFQITVTTPEQKSVKVDIDTATKLFSYAQADGMVKYGFSRLAVGDRITFAGSPDKADANLIAADRLVDFIDLPKDPRVVVTGTTTASPAASIAPVTPTAATNRNAAPAR
ncbi:MAG: hypothetical protein H0W89_04065 [Candidatus Levybacteria bacterium]|nr:hypothetical protein [Candidatus Levybacteria bacterium]